jgi:vanillate O-demethylase monooxygenase subunit
MDSMTPETGTSCHYFWRNARNYDIGNAELTKFLCGATTRAFDEDKVMVEAAQRIIDLDPEAPQVDIGGDAGGLQARRIVDRLLAEENVRQAAE